MNIPQSVQIIGIDCAADPEDIAIAYGQGEGCRLTVERVAFGKRRPRGKAAQGVDLAADRTRRLKDLATAVVAGIQRAGGPTLLALDAPLGWPSTMSTVLSDHRAGASPRELDADTFFRRRTDQFIACITNKTPLEVGANLIARVTHTTLRLIDLLRSGLKSARLELADAPIVCHEASPAKVNLIEVYPALAAPFFFQPATPEKNEVEMQQEKPEYWFWRNLSTAVNERKGARWVEIVDEFSRQSSTGADADTIMIAADRNDTTGGPITKAQQDHGVDAILAAWTGLRFCLGECIAPDDPTVRPKIASGTLKQEGWIWFDKRLPQRVPESRSTNDDK